MTEPMIEGGTGHEAAPREGLRPEPPRTQPIRSPAGIFGSAKIPHKGAADREARSSAGAADFASEAAEPVAAAGVSAADAIPGAILRAVTAGYRVVDEQLRQGRQTAREFWSPAPNDDPAAAQTGEPNAGNGPDVAQLGERLLRSVGELGISWLELMQAVSRPAPERAAEAGDERTAGPFAAGHAVPSSEGRPAREAVTSPLSVAIVASCPVELRVNLDGLPAEGELKVSPLVDPTGELPSIRGVTLRRVVESHTPEPRLRLEAVVDSAQPCGSYHGVVLSSTRTEPVGTLSLHIG